MSSDELKNLREELCEKYDGDLPDYLVDVFDEYQGKMAEREAYLERTNYYQRDNDFEDRRDYVRGNIKEFFSENETALYKSPYEHPKTNYPEPDKADNVVLTHEENSIVIKAACERNLEAFAKYYFPHYIKRPDSKFHKFLYKTLTRETLKGKGCRWAIAGPRHNAKSSIVSNIFPLWNIVYTKHKFILLISDTAGQAEDFLSDIKVELENNVLLNRDFPDACGKGDRVWRIDEILTKNGVRVKALGTGNKIRGRKFGTDRPTLICHAKGSQIIVDGNYINVEDYPNSKGFVDDGFLLNIYGLPYPEVVSYNHKYWCRTIDRRYYKLDRGWRAQRNLLEPEWKEINEVKRVYKLWGYDTYIGHPIDYSIESPETIEEYQNVITERNEKGQIVSMDTALVRKPQKEFTDPDFWWFVGLWWGDGYSSGKHSMTVTVNQRDVHIVEKLKSVLSKYNLSSHVMKRPGCFVVAFSWSKFARWLKSWRVGNSRKIPPLWVEKLDYELQKQLVLGYIASDGFIDYKSNSVRITSICYEGLLSLRRILARLGVPSSIRLGVGPYDVKIEGRVCRTQQKYDIRLREGVKEVLGIDIPNQYRYKFPKVLISDGYIWSLIRNIEEVDDVEFVAINTPDHTYLTDFGMSHNCGDDLENEEMVRSPIQRDFIRYEWFNKGLLFAGAGKEETYIFIVGTVIGKDSLLNALLDPVEYPDWSSRRFKAVEQFSDSPLWDEWARIYKDRFNFNRKEDAKKFFDDHKDEMLAGTRVLWPEGDPYYGLMEYKISNESAFLCEKQNEAVDYTKIYVTKDQLHFEHFHRPNIKEVLERCILYGAIDPSLGKKSTKGDYSAIITIGRDVKTGYLFVVDINAKRRTVDEQIDDILELYQRFRWKLFGIETNAFQYVMADNLRKKSRETGIYVPLKEVNQYQDKKMRIEGIVPLLKDGTFVFDSYKTENNSMYAMGIDQITTFTGENDKFDDIIDALEICFQIAKAPRFKLRTLQAKERHFR